MDKIRNFQFNRLFPIITTGLMIAIIDTFFEISLSTLLFSGPLSDYIPTGIGMLLFGAMIMNIVVSLTSSVPGMIAVPQDSSIAILAIITGMITVSMSGLPSEKIFATSVSAIILTTLLAGIFFLIMGKLKLSRLVRFVPYPVIGGFLAGTGWLILEGGISFLTGVPLAFSSLGTLLKLDSLVIWLPAFAFAVVLLIASRRSRNPLTIPVIMLVAIGLFYLWMVLSGTSVAEAETQGLLLGTFSQDTSWNPGLITNLMIADWSLILESSLQIGSVLIVTILAMLFFTSGIETTIHKDIDLDRELQSVGFANLIAGIGGSPVGHHALSFSTLTYYMKSASRWVGIVSATCVGIFLFLGLPLISYIPLIVIGGILLFLGLTFMVDWLIDGWVKLPLTDYGLMLVILLIIAAIGFLEGVAVGIGIALVLFVYNYSKLDIVKHKLSGDSYHSTVARPASQRNFLREHGNQIQILELQGYLFFGTAYNLLNTVRLRVSADQGEPLRFLVLNFRLVNGLDSSAAFIFNRIRQYGINHEFHIVLSNVSDQILKRLVKSGFPAEGDKYLHYSTSIDHGVELCENLILEDAKLAGDDSIFDLRNQLERVFSTPDEINRFFDYLEAVDIDPGQYLIHQGDPSDHLYFAESGMLSVELELDHEKEARVATIQGGTIVGEIGFYLGIDRTASVVASKPSRLYKLSRSSFKEMTKQDPNLAAGLHQWVAQILSERLSDNVKTLGELLE